MSIYDRTLNDKKVDEIKSKLVSNYVIQQRENFINTTDDSRNGDSIILETEQSELSQEWLIKKRYDGFYNIYLSNNKSLQWSIFNGSEQGNHIKLGWSSDGNRLSNKFKLIKRTDGYYNIYPSDNDNLNVSVWGGSSAKNKLRLNGSQNKDSPNHKFRLTKAENKKNRVKVSGVWAQYVRIYPIQWHSFPSLRWGVYRNNTLYNPSESLRTYSSVYGNNAKGTGQARSMLDSSQACSPSQPRKGEWAQIYLEKPDYLTGI